MPSLCPVKTYESDTRIDISDFEHRIGRYGRAKGSSELMADWLESRAGEQVRALLAAGRVVSDEAGTGLGRPTESQWWARSDFAVRSERLRECASVLFFRHYFTHPDRPIKLSGGRFCQQRLLCQYCALLRSAKLIRAYVPKLVELVRGGLQAWLFTGTARSGEDLSERFRHVDAALRELVRELNKARGNGSWHPWGDVRGGVFSFETKRGEGTRGGLWHPHVHGVLLLDDLPYTECDVLSMLNHWCELTGDSDIRGQDLRPLRSTMAASLAGGCEAMAESALCEAVGSDLLEVFKYPLKVSAMAPADRWEAFQALARRRLIRSFGCLWGVEPSRSMLDEFEAGDLPYVEFVCRYLMGQGAYDVQRGRVFSLDSGVIA